MIVAQKLVQEVNSFIRYKSLVLGINEAVPRLPLESAQNIVVLGVELNIVLVKIVEELIGSQDLGNLNQLIGVALAMEEGLLAEDHGRKHGAQAPHVEAVVILLKVYQQLGALEVARRHANVVFGTGVVELGETPIN